jgi:hypothetical protein
MARYVVSVERTKVEYTTVYVEAVNADLAAEMVEKDINAFLDGDHSQTNLLYGLGWDLESDEINITEDPYTED